MAMLSTDGAKINDRINFRTDIRALIRHNLMGDACKRFKYEIALKKIITGNRIRISSESNHLKLVETGCQNSSQK